MTVNHRTGAYTGELIPGTVYSNGMAGAEYRELLLVDLEPETAANDYQGVYFERVGPGWTTPNEPGQHRSVNSLRSFARGGPVAMALAL